MVVLTARRLAVIFLLFGLCCVSLLWFLSTRTTPFADPDSADYIEAGRNLAAGYGLTTWPYTYDQGGPIERGPLDEFPPVYPILIAAGRLVRLDAARAAALIPRVCYLLLPLAFFLALRRPTGNGPALAAALIASLQFDLVASALQAASDVPFLLMATVALAATFEAIVRGSRGYALAAGLAAGLALGTRNAGIALLAAVAFGVVVASSLGWIRTRALGELAVPYVAGAALAYGPVLLRSVVVFGKLSGYETPPSHKSWPQVFMELLRGTDLAFFAGKAGLVVLCTLALLVFGMSAVALFQGGGLRRLLAKNPTRVVFGLILLSYGGAGAALLLAAGRVYVIDELGGRLLVQYSWIALGWICVLGSFLLRFFLADQSRALLKAAQLIGGVLLLAVFLVPQLQTLRERRDLKAWELHVMHAHEPIVPLIRSLPEDTAAVAAFGPPLRILCDRPVLQLDMTTPDALVDRVGRDKNLVVILLNDDSPLVRPWAGAFSGHAPTGYREIRRAGDVIVLAHDKDKTPGQAALSATTH